MGVSKYKTRGKTFWKVDDHLKMPDGRFVRFRQRLIPTKEQAVALLAKRRADAFEGRFFERHKEATLTVAQAWALYKPISERDNDTWRTEKGRWEHLKRHLGEKMAAKLSQADVDGYRERRFGETTVRERPPSPGTLDREVELLKRILNYAVKCQRLDVNPLARVALLRKPNVRETVLDEEGFKRLVHFAHPGLQPILIVAYETGMRRGEVLGLKWSQVDLTAGCIRLGAADTKTEESRTIFLTQRAIETLDALPRPIHGGHVFVNPETGKRWQ
jgi:integrase